MKYFEDLAEGDEFETAARTITEADVVAFAALTGDWNPLHTDAEYAKTTPFGRRIAHGLLGITFAIGLLDRLGIFSGTVIANLGFTDWRFAKPVFIDDTIRVRVRIAEARLAADGTRGIVTREFTILNQRDEIVTTGKSPVMIRLRAQNTPS